MFIRIATREDLPRINEIYNQAVEEQFCTAHLEPVDMVYRRGWFASHDPARHPVFVADINGRPAGWVSLGPYRLGRQALDHVGEVSYYVDRAYRKKGLGTLLMNQVIGSAPEFGITVLIAILLDRNPASISLLRKSGFEEWGIMPGIALIGTQITDHLYYGLKL